MPGMAVEAAPGICLLVISSGLLIVAGSAMTMCGGQRGKWHKVLLEMLWALRGPEWKASHQVGSGA